MIQRANYSQVEKDILKLLDHCSLIELIVKNADAFTAKYGKEPTDVLVHLSLRSALIREVYKKLQDTGIIITGGELIFEPMKVGKTSVVFTRTMHSQAYLCVRNTEMKIAEMLTF